VVQKAVQIASIQSTPGHGGLQKVIDAWPHLDDVAKVKILAIVEGRREQR
jgi:hypothetical protein